jgi:poly(A) polymerase
VKQMKTSKLKRFLRNPWFEDHLELHRLDCLASHGGLDNYTFCKEKLAEYGDEDVDLRPPPLVNGNTLIAMGFSPGPLFKTILTEVEDLQLEGGITTEEEAIRHIKKKYQKK